MNLKVQRKLFTPLSTTGALYIDGEFAAFTLEPPWKTDETKPRAIPPGTYSVSLSWSPKHSRNVPHVDNVPDFEDIEIHPGNFPEDTLGCLLLGTGIAENEVLHSVIAFTDVYDKIATALEASEPVDITYCNPENA